MSVIHPTAVVAPDAEVGPGCVIGPYVVVCAGVILGPGVVLGPHAVIGTAPEIAGVAQQTPWLHPADGVVAIGAGTVVREHVTIQRPSREITSVGADCLLMSGAYLAHDTSLADGVVVSAGVRLAGHVQVGAQANLGMGAVVHQFRVVGGGAMVGMGSAVTRDVPPYAKAFGNPARIRGANSVGLRRAGVPADQIAALERALRETATGPAPEAYAAAGLAAASEWFSGATAHGD